jgi:hypothetical protein
MPPISNARFSCPVAAAGANNANSETQVLLQRGARTDGGKATRAGGRRFCAPLVGRVPEDRVAAHPPYSKRPVIEFPDKCELSGPHAERWGFALSVKEMKAWAKV